MVKSSPNTTSGIRFALGVLIFAAIWMIVRVSGVFKNGPDRLPPWAFAPVALVVLAGPAIFTLADRVHWMIRLFAALLFFVSGFVFPWFYDRFPLFFWLTVLLAYIEVFWLLPRLLKNRQSRDG